MVMKSLVHLVSKIIQCKSSNIGSDLNFNYVVKYVGNVNHLDSLPMLIALHGDGDTARNFYETALDKFTVSARIILIEAPISHEMGKVWPYSAVQFLEYGKAFSDFAAILTTKFPTVDKPVLLGFSGGGTMAYYQAVKHGNKYSNIFPISGLLFNEQLGGRVSKPAASVYAYHGKSDEVVSFLDGKKAANLLKKKGVGIRFIEFESGHHGFFSDMKLVITQNVEERLRSLL